MKQIVMLGVVLAAIYSTAAFVIGSRWAAWENEERERILLIKRLGAEVMQGDASQLAPLAEACSGKLEQGGPMSLVGYVMPTIDGDDDEIGDRVMGLIEYPEVSPDSSARFDAQETWVRHPGPERTLAGEFLGALDPMTWSYKTKRQGAGGSPEVRDARYVAITRVHELVWPEEQGEVYIPGNARLETRVLTLPEGKPVCAGESYATRRGTIEMEGRGKTKAEAETRAWERLSFHVKAYFINAIQYGPLVLLCDAAGKAFCEQMGQEAPNVR